MLDSSFFRLRSPTFKHRLPPHLHATNSSSLKLFLVLFLHRMNHKGGGLGRSPFPFMISAPYSNICFYPCTRRDILKGWQPEPRAVPF